MVGDVISDLKFDEFVEKVTWWVDTFHGRLFFQFCQLFLKFHSRLDKLLVISLNLFIFFNQSFLPFFFFFLPSLLLYFLPDIVLLYLGLKSFIMLVPTCSCITGDFAPAQWAAFAIVRCVIESLDYTLLAESVVALKSDGLEHLYLAYWTVKLRILQGLWHQHSRV